MFEVILFKREITSGIRSLTFVLVLLSVYSCGLKAPTDKTSTVIQEKAPEQNHVPEFDSLLVDAELIGSILIFDSENNVYYSNNFKWAGIGRLPASTFKIPNSILAIEFDIVANDSTIIPWNGVPRGMEIWERDLKFRDALQFSCVPCYQDIALKIGLNRMNSYVNKLTYGDMKIDSNTLTSFWFRGESKINQFEQIDFLSRFYQFELPIKRRTNTIVKKMLLQEENERFKLSGKTGWSNPEGKNNGWYVGYLESNEKVYFFATNIAPKGEFKRDHFVNMRSELTKSALRLLDFMPVIK